MAGGERPLNYNQIEQDVVAILKSAPEERAKLTEQFLDEFPWDDLPDDEQLQTYFIAASSAEIPLKDFFAVDIYNSTNPEIRALAQPKVMALKVRALVQTNPKFNFDQNVIEIGTALKLKTKGEQFFVTALIQESPHHRAPLLKRLFKFLNSDRALIEAKKRRIKPLIMATNCHQKWGDQILQHISYLLKPSVSQPAELECATITHLARFRAGLTSVMQTAQPKTLAYIQELATHIIQTVGEKGTTEHHVWAYHCLFALQEAVPTHNHETTEQLLWCCSILIKSFDGVNSPSRYIEDYFFLLDQLCVYQPALKLVTQEEGPLAKDKALWEIDLHLLATAYPAGLPQQTDATQHDPQQFIETMLTSRYPDSLRHAIFKEIQKRLRSEVDILAILNKVIEAGQTHRVLIELFMYNSSYDSRNFVQLIIMSGSKNISPIATTVAQAAISHTKLLSKDHFQPWTMVHFFFEAILFITDLNALTALEKQAEAEWVDRAEQRSQEVEINTRQLVLSLIALRRIDLQVSTSNGDIAIVEAQLNGVDKAFNKTIKPTDSLSLPYNQYSSFIHTRINLQKSKQALKKAGAPQNISKWTKHVIICAFPYSLAKPLLSRIHDSYTLISHLNIMNEIPYLKFHRAVLLGAPPHGATQIEVRSTWSTKLVLKGALVRLHAQTGIEGNIPPVILATLRTQHCPPPAEPGAWPQSNIEGILGNLLAANIAFHDNPFRKPGLQYIPLNTDLEAVRTYLEECKDPYLFILAVASIPPQQLAHPDNREILKKAVRCFESFPLTSKGLIDHLTGRSVARNFMTSFLQAWDYQHLDIIGIIKKDGITFTHELFLFFEKWPDNCWGSTDQKMRAKSQFQALICDAVFARYRAVPDREFVFDEKTISACRKDLFQEGLLESDWSWRFLELLYSAPYPPVDPDPDHIIYAAINFHHQYAENGELIPPRRFAFKGYVHELNPRIQCNLQRPTGNYEEHELAVLTALTTGQYPDLTKSAARVSPSSQAYLKLEEEPEQREALRPLAEPYTTPDEREAFVTFLMDTVATLPFHQSPLFDKRIRELFSKQENGEYRHANNINASLMREWSHASKEAQSCLRSLTFFPDRSKRHNGIITLIRMINDAQKPERIDKHRAAGFASGG